MNIGKVKKNNEEKQVQVLLLVWSFFTLNSIYRRKFLIRCKMMDDPFLENTKKIALSS